MADELKLPLILDLAQAQKQLDDLGKKGIQVKSGSIVSNQDVQNATNLAKQLEASQTKLKLLTQSQADFAAKGAVGAAGYAKVTAELAGIEKGLRKNITDQEAFNQSVQKEIELRKKANEALGGSGTQFSAHSQRQAQLLESLKSGASGVSGVASSAGIPGASGLGSLASAAGPLAALTVAATGLAKVFDDMGKKAEETAKIISDSGGKYDQVAASALKVKQANDRLADDPVFAAFEKFKNDLQSSGLDILKAGIDKIAQIIDSLPGVGSSDEDKAAAKKKAAAAEAARTTKLKGDALVEYENLKHERVSMEKEIAMSEQQFAIETERKKRDLALETKEFEIQQQNKLFDLQKAGAREQRDYQHNLQKLNADVEFKASQEKYDLERKNERQVFNLKQSDDAARFQRQLSYDQAEFQRQQQYKAQDFAIASGRKLEDYATNLNRMALTGGGSATDYLFGAQDFRKEQRRASQDYQLQTGREASEFGIKKGQEKTEFGISQTQERRNQAIEQELKTKEHSIDVETHLYSLKQQEYELTTKHNDAVQDDIEALRRLSVETDIGRQKLANKASDLAQDTALTRQKMDFDEAEKRRSQSNKEFEFGGNLANQLPAGDLKNLMKSNPELAKFVQGDFARKGLPMPTGGTPFMSGEGHFGDQAIAMVQNYIAAHPEMRTEAADFLKKLTGNEVPAFADGGYYDLKSPGPAILHPGELVLNKQQQQQLFNFGKSGTATPGLVPINPSDHAGFGYGRGGATGLVPLTATNNGTANGAPLSAMPMPINMPGGGGAGGVYNVQIGGNNNYNFDGFPPELKSKLQAMEQSHQQDMQRLLQQSIGGSFNTMRRVQGYQQ